MGFIGVYVRVRIRGIGFDFRGHVDFFSTGACKSVFNVGT